MRYRGLGLRVGMILGLLLLGPFTVCADPDLPDLFLREVKITGDEFVVLQANRTISLNDYWLGYTGSDTATNIVPTEQLPAHTLQAGQALLLTSDGAMTCDAVQIAKLSFSLSDTKGTLVVRQLQSSGNTSTFTTVDSVNWAKSTSSTKTSDPIDLGKEAGLTYPVWFHDGTGVSGWRVGDFADCSETFAATDTVPVTTVTWPQSQTDPPALIESLADDGDPGVGPYLPPADVGLLPPQITELLPNPTGTGTDGTDEFIELYNPNAASFDLSGFVLRTGLTTKHSYTFPASTIVAPKSFTAFYSADTGLAMSNSGGQADLTDPFGTVIAETDAYGSAKDGMAWALAKGTWYWTVKTTPNSANVIDQVATGTKTIKTTLAKSAAAAVKGSATSKSPLQKGVAASASTAVAPAPIHAGVLAAVAVLAVGYGVYEYRHDLANRFHQFRQHRAARRKARG